LAALFRTVRVWVQPVAMSVPVKVKQNSPLGSPPSWPTRSTSMNPGIFSSQSAQVRIGICDLSKPPCLVRVLPRLVASSARSAVSRRSMVAADIAHSPAATSSVISSSRCRRSEATCSPITGASRFPVGPSNTAHTLRNASITSGP